MKPHNTLAHVGIGQRSCSCLWLAGMLFEQVSVGGRQSDSYSNNPAESWGVGETLTADLFAPAVCSNGHIILQCCVETVLHHNHNCGKPAWRPQLYLLCVLCNVQGCCGVDWGKLTPSRQHCRSLLFMEEHNVESDDSTEVDVTVFLPMKF